LGGPFAQARISNRGIAVARQTKKIEPQSTVWAADKVERRSVEALVPYARNSRTHSPEQVDQIVASVREFGWTIPVLIDETGVIIAGHGRVMAAKKMGLTDIPVMVAAGWSEHQKRAYVIADNKTAENAGWDLKMLRVELAELDMAAYNVDLTGFSAKEIADLIPVEASPKKKSEPAPMICTCPSCGHEFEAGEVTMTVKGGERKKRRSPKGPVEGPMH
jgi:hypothetical protein